MRRIFTIISILITISLIGTIFIQVSWIKSLALVKEDIIKQKISGATKKVASELYGQLTIKGSLASGPRKNSFLKDTYGKDFSKMFYASKDVNLDEVRNRMTNLLEEDNIKNVQIELAYASFEDNTFKNATQNFLSIYENDDTTSNFHCNYIIDPLSGTADENLIGKSALFVVVPHIKSLVYKSL